MKELIDKNELLREIAQELTYVRPAGMDSMYHVIEMIRAAKTVIVLDDNNKVVIPERLMNGHIK